VFAPVVYLPGLDMSASFAAVGHKLRHRSNTGNPADRLKAVTVAGAIRGTLLIDIHFHLPEAEHAARFLQLRKIA